MINSAEAAHRLVKKMLKSSTAAKYTVVHAATDVALTYTKYVWIIIINCHVCLYFVVSSNVYGNIRQHDVNDTPLNPATHRAVANGPVGPAMAGPIIEPAIKTNFNFLNVLIFIFLAGFSRNNKREGISFRYYF